MESNKEEQITTVSEENIYKLKYLDGIGRQPNAELEMRRSAV